VIVILTETVWKRLAHASTGSTVTIVKTSTLIATSLKILALTTVTVKIPMAVAATLASRVMTAVLWTLMNGQPVTSKKKMKSAMAKESAP
jgi:hypothetical protein